MAIDVITLQINHLGITTALIITFGAFEVQGGFCFDKGFGFFTKPAMIRNCFIGFIDALYRFSQKFFNQSSRILHNNDI